MADESSQKQGLVQVARKIRKKPNILPHSSEDFINTFPALSHNPESEDFWTITFVKFWTHKSFPNLGKAKFHLNAIRMDS